MRLLRNLTVLVAVALGSVSIWHLASNDAIVIRGVLLTETNLSLKSMHTLVKSTAKVMAHQGRGRTVSGSSVAVAYYKGYTYYLTNRHVALKVLGASIEPTNSEGTPQTSAELLFQDKSTAKTEVVHVSVTSDLAILRVNGKRPIVTLAAKAPKLMDAITVIGGPGGIYPVITNGFITQLNLPIMDQSGSMLISAGGAPGSSGSPVYNSKGDLVGLIFAGRRGMHLAVYAIGYNSIKAYFNRLADNGEFKALISGGPAKILPITSTVTSLKRQPMNQNIINLPLRELRLF